MKNNRIGLWVAGSVVMVAVIIGVVGLVLPRDGNTSSAPSNAATASAATIGEGPCPDMLSPSTTSTVPADLRWVASQGVTWPVSATVGPTSTTDGFPTCFQQSPIGAALFSTGFLAGSVDHPALDLLDFYLAPSTEKDDFLQAARSAASGSRSMAEQLKDIGANYVGYRIDSFEGSSAAITVVLSVPNTPTGYRGIKISSGWTESDWRVTSVLDQNGSNAVFDVLDGQFTRWAS